MAAILTYPTNPPSVRRHLQAQPGVMPSSAHGPGVVQSAEVYRRRRLLVLTIVMLLFVVLWSFGRSAQSATTHESRFLDEIVVVVEPGDTLWDIASRLNPGSDPRPLVDTLSAIAGSGTLQPGQTLLIPGYLLE